MACFNKATVEISFAAILIDTNPGTGNRSFYELEGFFVYLIEKS